MNLIDFEQKSNKNYEKRILYPRTSRFDLNNENFYLLSLAGLPHDLFSVLNGSFEQKITSRRRSKMTWNAGWQLSPFKQEVCDFSLINYNVCLSWAAQVQRNNMRFQRSPVNFKNFKLYIILYAPQLRIRLIDYPDTFCESSDDLYPSGLKIGARLRSVKKRN